ncbi:MAG: Crp/Fnr family transcriptional regulator [Clostridiales Family XIII bacterium]|nr:Crp/Fnr family transcriptional regulator [Clostridiales Family XIII bacterium]
MKISERDIELLKHNTLFADLAAEDVSSVAPAIAVRLSEYKKDEHLAKAGGIVKNFGILLSGSAVSYIHLRNLPPHIVRFYQTHEMVCLEYAASAAAAPVSVIGTEPGRVLWMSYDKLFAAPPEAIRPPVKDRLHRNLLAISTSDTIRLEKIKHMMSMHGVRDRLLAYLLIVSETTGEQAFTVNLKQYEIAAFMGVSKTRLSVELRCLAEEGIVSYNAKKGRFSIKKDLTDCILLKGNGSDE